MSEQPGTPEVQTETAVDKYETVVYAPESYSSAVSARQRAYLRRLVRRSFTERRPVQHDFACGTGRAIRLLHGVVRAAHGYDVSAAMLAKARDSGVYAKLHEIPGDGPLPAPAPAEGPALVTIFRLLLNVTPEVRDRAMAFAAAAHTDLPLGHMRSGGARQGTRQLMASRLCGRGRQT